MTVSEEEEMLTSKRHRVQTRRFKRRTLHSQTHRAAASPLHWRWWLSSFTHHHPLSPCNGQRHCLSGLTLEMSVGRSPWALPFQPSAFTGDQHWSHHCAVWPSAFPPWRQPHGLLEGRHAAPRFCFPRAWQTPWCREGSQGYWANWRQTALAGKGNTCSCH